MRKSLENRFEIEDPTYEELVENIMKNMNKNSFEIANVDKLTNMPNRRGLEKYQMSIIIPVIYEQFIKALNDKELNNLNFIDKLNYFHNKDYSKKFEKYLNEAFKNNIIENGDRRTNYKEFKINDERHSSRRGEINKASFIYVLSDLDSFKAINDIYGHNFGDFVLQQMSKHLFGARKYDGEGWKLNLNKISSGLDARAGGEEFVKIIPGDRYNLENFVENKLKKAKFKVDKANIKTSEYIIDTEKSLNNIIEIKNSIMYNLLAPLQRYVTEMELEEQTERTILNEKIYNHFYSVNIEDKKIKKSIKNKIYNLTNKIWGNKGTINTRVLDESAKEILNYINNVTNNKSINEYVGNVKGIDAHKKEIEYFENVINFYNKYLKNTLNSASLKVKDMLEDKNISFNDNKKTLHITYSSGAVYVNYKDISDKFLDYFIDIINYSNVKSEQNLNKQEGILYDLFLNEGGQLVKKLFEDINNLADDNLNTVKTLNKGAIMFSRTYNPNLQK